MREIMSGFIVMMFFCVSLFSVHTISAQDIAWSCRINAYEPGGSFDYAVIGEASDAVNGPPPDTYDVAKPPSPILPFLRVWLNDSLPEPYNYLWMDYRHYPGVMTVWNLSIQWVPSDGSSPTIVTLTWNITDLQHSEYSVIQLCTMTGTPLQDMLVSDSYVFSCPANIAQGFTIVAEKNNSAPETPAAPVGNSTGYHGTSYSYATSTTDPDGDALYYLFDWGDATTSGWLGPSQNGSGMSDSHSWEAPGTYAVMVQARDIYGHTSGWSNATVVTMMNRAPNFPGNASPANRTTGVSITPVLSWTGGDPDAGDIVSYDIYFGATASPPKIVENQSIASFAPGTLAYLTTYYWRIRAADPYGGSSIGSLWSFTTVASSSGGGGGPPSGGENHPPIANASASDRVGVVGMRVVFNGSLSSDSDGYLTKWSWDFGDGTSGNGEVTTHAYTHAGTYTVVLTVTDNNGTTDADTLQVVITTANHAPTTPSLEGTTVGTGDIAYTYLLSSADADGDFLRYLVTWGDGTSSTSDFFPNGTVCSLTHAWSSPGKYLVEAAASDNITFSEKTRLTVFIDVHFLGVLGFLYDLNGDGSYDTFYSNTTGNVTNVQRLANGTYLIDSNGAGVWNYYYNPNTDTLSVISPVPTTNNQYIFFVIIGVAIIVIIAIVYWYKKRRF